MCQNFGLSSNVGLSGKNEKKKRSTIHQVAQTYRLFLRTIGLEDCVALPVLGLFGREPVDRKWCVPVDILGMSPPLRPLNCSNFFFFF